MVPGLFVAVGGAPAARPITNPTLEVSRWRVLHHPHLDEFVRIRGSLSPSDDVYFYFKGEIFAAELPDEGTSEARRFRKPLLYLEGVNVARFIPVENGFRMLSREVAYYLDDEGKIVDCLSLDWRDEPVRVRHIANDPVNFTLSAPASHLLGAMKVYVVNASMDYPSPLGTRDDVDDYGGKTYQSTELFQFYARRSDLSGSSSKCTCLDELVTGWPAFALDEESRYPTIGTLFITREVTKCWLALMDFRSI